jgi:hypothetical protein
VVGVDLTLHLRLRLTDLGVELRLGSTRDLLTTLTRWATPHLGARAATLGVSLISTVEQALARAGVVPVPGLAGLHHLVWRALPAGPDTAPALVLLGNLPLDLRTFTDATSRRAISPHVRLEALDAEHLAVQERSPVRTPPGAPERFGPWQTRDPRALSAALHTDALGAVLERTNWTVQAVDGTRLRLLYADGGVVPAATVLAVRARALAQPHPRGNLSVLQASLPPGVALRVALSPLLRERLRAAMAPRVATEIHRLSGEAELSLNELDIDWHTNPVPGRITVRVRVKVERDLGIFGADGLATAVQDIDLRLDAGRLRPTVPRARVDADGWLEFWGGLMDFLTAGFRAVGADIPTSGELLEEARMGVWREVLAGVNDGLDQVPAGVEYAREATPAGPRVLWLDLPIQDLRLGPQGAALHIGAAVSAARPGTPATGG